jgi:hypothetical protein
MNAGSASMGCAAYPPQLGGQGWVAKPDPAEPAEPWDGPHDLLAFPAPSQDGKPTGFAQTIWPA